MQPCEAEPRTIKPAAEIKITYLEFDGAHLSYAEWTEDGEEHHAHDVPREVREHLAMSILK